MRLLLTFTRAYPWQTVMMFFALLLAGGAEGISVSMLLPLVNLAIQQEINSVTPHTAAHTASGSRLEETMTSILRVVGIDPTIGVLLAVVVGAIIFKSLLMLFAQKRVGYMVAQLTTDLRLMLLRSILSARWAYFVHQPVGRLANAMTSEPMRASEAYVKGVTVVTLLMQTCIYTGVAFLVSWQATLISLIAGAAILVASHFLVNMARHAGRRQTNLMKSLSARLTDMLQSVKPLKSMSRGDLVDAWLVAQTGKLNKALRKAVFSKAALKALQEPMSAVVIASGIFVALVYWHVSLATILVLVLLLVRVLVCLGKVQKEYQNMVTDESAFWSLRQTIEEAEQATEQSLHGIEARLKARIALEGVEVVYHDKAVLTGLSLEIPAGMFTALVGPSGAGKTTIVDLVTGLIRPQAGEVYIDSIAMATIDLWHWRRQIGYVPQDNLLLHDSIFMNVTLGDPALGPVDVEYALRAAGAWAFVTRMPDGIHTLVGERGTRLSGGQRQRIMLARALVHRPTLLILDEATTALDPSTEAAICSTLRQLVGDVTILAVSHQPAILDVADRVYEIQDGRAVPIANHQPGAVGKATGAALHSSAQP